MRLIHYSAWGEVGKWAGLDKILHRLLSGKGNSSLLDEEWVGVGTELNVTADLPYKSREVSRGFDKRL